MEVPRLGQLDVGLKKAPYTVDPQGVLTQEAFISKLL